MREGKYMTKTLNNEIVKDMLAMVERFNREVIGISIPDKPTPLSLSRQQWGEVVIKEELEEFMQANTLADQADALLDITYFALGRLVEMGVAPLPVFQEVNRANMQKERGIKSTREGSQGFDAIKPVGWTPPNLQPYLNLSREDLDNAYGLCYPVPSPVKPKILIIGHARHGKDTVSEVLRDDYGFKFTSSSLFCAETVVMPVMNANGHHYQNAEECFEDRQLHRKEWFDLISMHNSDDPTRLSREMLVNHDVYCGMRSRRELNACKNAGIFDAIIWVDASRRQPPEAKDSCDVEEWMADFTIDNNGSQEDLMRNIAVLMKTIEGSL